MSENKQLTNEELSKRDYIIMIDKSGSMSTPHKSGRSRWKYCQENVENLARKCGEFDSDGIDVVVFASGDRTYNNVTPEKVHQIFTENEPGGSTNTAGALGKVLDGYFARKTAGSAKPITIIVATDGIPDDQKAVAKVIKDATLKMDADEEIGISFIQVGDDSSARTFLKSLDDDLESEGAKFDIVDTRDEAEMDNMTMTDVLLAAVGD